LAAADGKPCGAGDRGFVIEVVLLGCMVVFIFAISMIDTGARRVRSAGTEYRQAQAFYAAEAGVARAAADLARGGDLGWTEEPREIGACTYSVELDRDEGGDVTVVSTGEFRRPNGERISVPLRAVLRRDTAGEGWKTVAWERLTP
jgi:hypothetical protein